MASKQSKELKNKTIADLMQLRIELQDLHDSVLQVQGSACDILDSINEQERSLAMGVNATFPMSATPSGLVYSGNDNFKIIKQLKDSNNEDAKNVYQFHMKLVAGKKLVRNDFVHAINSADNLTTVELPKKVKSDFDKFIREYVSKFMAFEPLIEEIGELRDVGREAFDVYEQSKPVYGEKQITLEKRYAHLLHESDFENLDFILYLFVTGRAETMKEALQLLDEERRSQRLVNAVETSAHYIVANFERIMDNFGKKLEAAISSSTMQIMEAINSLELKTYVDVNVNIDGTKIPKKID